MAAPADPIFVLAQTTGRIEGRIEQFLSNQDRHASAIDDHETRITNIETARSESKGSNKVFIAMGVGFTALAGVIADLAGVWH